jgi:nitric oxide dioxygenase
MRITRHPLCAASTLHGIEGIPPDVELADRLQRSFGSISKSGLDLADRFYSSLFGRHPELRSMFPVDLTEQKRKLLTTLRIVVENLRAPQVARAHLEHLGHRHRAYGAKSEHYSVVCELLVQAMGETAGAEWSAELKADWTSALKLVSAIMQEGAARPEFPRSNREPPSLDVHITRIGTKVAR